LATTIGHDSHNITAIGSDDENIKLAIKTLQDIHGGYVVVKNNKVLATLSLPIAGLFSDAPIQQIIQHEAQLSKALNETVKSHNFTNPFLTMSFLSLTVIPEIRITTKGVYKTK
jgi:adenine deaminase